MSNQYKVAALVLDFFNTKCNKDQATLKSEFRKDHGAAFDFLGTVLDEVDKNDMKESFFEEHISAANRAFVIETIGLQ